MNRIKTTVVAALFVSFVGWQPAPTLAQGSRDRRDRYEDRRDRQEARRDYWDAARYRQDNRRYRARRLGMNNYAYRGSGALLGRAIDDGDVQCR